MLSSELFCIFAVTVQAIDKPLQGTLQRSDMALYMHQLHPEVHQNVCRRLSAAIAAYELLYETLALVKSAIQVPEPGCDLSEVPLLEAKFSQFGPRQPVDL